MKSILSDLYNGNINPFERVVPQGEEYRNLNRKIDEELQKFKKILSQENYDKVENVLDLAAQASCMEIEESFINGFRTGTMFMVEVFMGESKMARE